MLTNQELDIAALMLTAMHGNAFAFYVVGRGGNAHDIYFALPHTTNTGSQWSPIILAMQHMGWGETLRGNVPVIYRGSGAACTNTAEGMRRFFGLSVVERNLNGYPAYGLQHLQMLWNNLPPNTNFIVIVPDNVLRRNELDPFIPAGLGAAPGFGIDFDSRSSHLHRLYMALAFRRARYKFNGRNDQGHLIAAVLVDKTNGSVRAIADNTKHVNATFHAEVNVVQAFLKHSGGERNHQFILYTTLQPCPMCAAMIAEFMPNTMVFYGQTDTGLHMGDIVLEPHFCHSMMPRWGEEYLLKPVRGWGTNRWTDWDDYKSFDGYKGTHGDMHDDMNKLHQAKRKVKYYNDNTGQMVYPGASLTRNLRTDPFKARINTISRTLDRKVLQYIAQVDLYEKLNWGRHVNDKNGVVVYERHEDIQKVMVHIFPLIQNL